MSLRVVSPQMALHIWWCPQPQLVMGLQVYRLDIDINDVVCLILIYWFLPFIVPDLHEYPPINLILTGFDAGYGHIYYATDCYRHISASYIRLQSLIPMLRHTINRGDNDRSTTSTEATRHYRADLFFADEMCSCLGRILYCCDLLGMQSMRTIPQSHSRISFSYSVSFGPVRCVHSPQATIS